MTQSCCQLPCHDRIDTIHSCTVDRLKATERGYTFTCGNSRGNHATATECQYDEAAVPPSGRSTLAGRSPSWPSRPRATTCVSSGALHRVFTSNLPWFRREAAATCRSGAHEPRIHPPRENWMWRTRPIPSSGCGGGRYRHPQTLSGETGMSLLTVSGPFEFVRIEPKERRPTSEGEKQRKQRSSSWTERIEALWPDKLANP